MQVSEISKDLSLDLMNLRRLGSLNPLGEISIRIECISNVGEWKEKNIKLLESRRKQIEKILELEVTQESTGKVYIPTSFSDQRISKMTYYNELEYVDLN